MAYPPPRPEDRARARAQGEGVGMGCLVGGVFVVAAIGVPLAMVGWLIANVVGGLLGLGFSLRYGTTDLSTAQEIQSLEFLRAQVPYLSFTTRLERSPPAGCILTVTNRDSAAHSLRVQAVASVLYASNLPREYVPAQVDGDVRLGEAILTVDPGSTGEHLYTSLGGNGPWWARNASSEPHPWPDTHLSGCVVSTSRWMEAVGIGQLPTCGIELQPLGSAAPRAGRRTKAHTSPISARGVTTATSPSFGQAATALQTRASKGATGLLRQALQGVARG